MKKILFALLAVPLLFAACSDKDDETPATPTLGFTLTNEMVEVEGLSQDYLVVVDHASKTVEIEIAYADKAELKALTVKFVKLPAGAEAKVATPTFDYSNGAENTVTLSANGATEVYTIKVSVGQPDPHFVSAALNDVESASGVARLKGSSDLTKVIFTYTVAPEGTKVYVGETEIASGDEVDFSDKLNGVNFTLKCEEVSKTENIKVVTSGISSVERVWGHYVKPKNVTDDWFGTAVAASGWERTIAMDDQYVYMAKAKSGDDKGCYAISISDPSQVKQLSVNGIVGAGVFHTSDAKVMDNGSSSVLLLSNMANAKDSHIYLYAYTSVDADPTVALDYVLPEAHRLGDKFTVEGDWQNGKIWFFNQAGSTPRNAYVFSVTNGVVNATPAIVPLDTTLGNLGGIGSMFRYSAGEYLWSGAGTYSSVYSVSGETFTQTLLFNNELGFTQPMHGIGFFTFNDQKYMSFVRLENSYQDATLRIMELNYETLKESIEKNNITDVCHVLGLGDPTEIGITATKNGNGLGDAVVREIGGETYIAAMAPGAGVSLFKLVK